MINEIVRILCSPGYWIGGLSVCINGSVTSVGRLVGPSVIHFHAPIGAFVVIRVQLFNNRFYVFLFQSLLRNRPFVPLMYLLQIIIRRVLDLRLYVCPSAQYGG